MMAFPLASCGGDDDDKSNEIASNGVISVEYVGAKTFTKYAYDAKWHAGHQEVHGSVLDHPKNGATFSAYLSEEKASSDIGVDYLSSVRWQFETTDEITSGAELTMINIHWPETSQSSSYFCDEFSGKVVVKSVNNSQVTLQFKNFRFKRMTKFVVGRSEYQDLIVNGDITFTKE